MFRLATQRERIFLGKVRATSWRGPLTEDQFLRRNELLYEHPYGKHMRTYVLGEKEILSSMDVLDIEVARNLKSKTSTERGNLIASVITPVEKRLQGYASGMLDHFLKEASTEVSILYSDVDPTFYERHGFQRFPRFRIDRTPIDRPLRASATSLTSFCEHVRDLRLRDLTSNGNFTVLPTEPYLDWVFHRYRYFSEISRQNLESPFWRNVDGHFLFVTKNGVYNRLEVLWKEPGCTLCIEETQRMGHAWGAGTIESWEEVGRGPDQNPMARVNGIPFCWKNIDWMDWW